MDKVHVVNMTENNPPQIPNPWSPVTSLGQLLRVHLNHARTVPSLLEHPHSPEFSTSKNLARPVDVITNSFCAVRGSAFSSLLEPEAGWGRPWKRNWVSNQAVTHGGLLL
jgi:hypothetical protein